MLLNCCCSRGSWFPLVWSSSAGGGKLSPPYFSISVLFISLFTYISIVFIWSCHTTIRRYCDTEEDKLVRALGTRAPEGECNIAIRRRTRWCELWARESAGTRVQHIAPAFRCSNAQSLHQLILLRLANLTSDRVQRAVLLCAIPKHTKSIMLKLHNSEAEHDLDHVDRSWPTVDHVHYILPSWDYVHVLNLCTGNLCCCSSCSFYGIPPHV